MSNNARLKFRSSDWRKEAPVALQAAFIARLLINKMQVPKIILPDRLSFLQKILAGIRNLNSGITGWWLKDFSDQLLVNPEVCNDHRYGIDDISTGPAQ